MHSIIVANLQTHLNQVTPRGATWVFALSYDLPRNQNSFKLVFSISNKVQA